VTKRTTTKENKGERKMKSNVILATTWASTNASKIRFVTVGALVILGLLAGVGPQHQMIAQAGPAIGGSH
jgi:hypothetical protein